MAGDLQKDILIEQRIANDGKSLVLAYIFLICLGWFGVHRFYLGRIWTGLCMLVLLAIGWVFSVAAIGYIAFAPLGLWLLIDLLLIPGMIHRHKSAMRMRLAEELSAA